MTKRLLLLVLCFVVAIISAFADEQKIVTLNNETHRSETIPLDYGNIFISLSVDSYHNVKVVVELENTDESKTLMLFDREYDEKPLRRIHITYDKSFGGSRGKRTIDKCSNLRQTCKITPTNRQELFDELCTQKRQLIYQLPIYIAKNKNKSGSKLLLLGKQVVQLKINILITDSEFLEIKNAYTALIDSIDSEQFCTNKNHQGESFKSLKKKYESKINELKQKIIKIKKDKNYFDSDNEWEKYKELLSDLDKISIDSKAVTSCPNDKKIGHNCRYCRLSYEEIYQKLANYYQDIYNGTKTKSQVMKEVEALYQCATKNTHRTANTSLKNRIADYYNRIKSYK